MCYLKRTIVVNFVDCCYTYRLVRQTLTFATSRMIARQVEEHKLSEDFKLSLEILGICIYTHCCIGNPGCASMCQRSKASGFPLYGVSHRLYNSILNLDFFNM